MRIAGSFSPVRIVAFASLLIAGTMLTSHARSLAVSKSTSDLARTSRSGDELVAVLLITPTCGAAQSESFKESLRQALAGFRTVARVHGYQPYVVGVALSSNSERTLEFISSLAVFDEVVVGRGWLSSGAVSYIWRDIPGVASVPQLLLLHRRVEVSADGWFISPDSLLLRLTGAGDIAQWAAAGSPLDL